MNNEKRPYDLEALDPDELETLLHKRPDLRREIMAEGNRRIRRAECAGLNELI